MAKLQCKDISDVPVLRLLARFDSHATIFEGFANSVQQGMPANTPKNLVRAKMDSLIRRKLVDGCTCGCRGDFKLTDAGREALATRQDPDSPEVKALQDRQALAYHAVTLAMNNCHDENWKEDSEVVAATADYDKTVSDLVDLLGEGAFCNAVDIDLYRRFSDLYVSRKGFRPYQLVTRQDCLDFIAAA